MALPIGSVVTSFNPPETFYENIKAIAHQSAFVTIIDNASDVKYRDLFQKIQNDFKNVSITLNEKNLGVATALNQGVTTLSSKDIKWIATFDHDTKIPDEYFASLLASINTAKDIGKILLVGPKQPGSTSSSILERPAVLITSGCLHRRDTFELIGLFKDKFFIDCVDHEFCLRVWSNGYIVIEVSDVKIIHELGYPQKSNFLWMTFYTSNYSTLRRFSMFRNSVWLTKLYFPLKISWFFQHWTSLAKDAIKLVLAEENRYLKFLAVCKGFLQGLTQPSP